MGQQRLLICGLIRTVSAADAVLANNEDRAGCRLHNFMLIVLWWVQSNLISTDSVFFVLTLLSCQIKKCIEVAFLQFSTKSTQVEPFRRVGSYTLSESSREQEGQWAKGPRSESSRERIGQGPIGRFAQGSELARERKSSVPDKLTIYICLGDNTWTKLFSQYLRLFPIFYIVVG